MRNGELQACNILVIGYAVVDGFNGGDDNFKLCYGKLNAVVGVIEDYVIILCLNAEGALLDCIATNVFANFSLEGAEKGFTAYVVFNGVIGKVGVCVSVGLGFCLRSYGYVTFTYNVLSLCFRKLKVDVVVSRKGLVRLFYVNA